jgi:hypothetical protein
MEAESAGTRDETEDSVRLARMATLGATRPGSVIRRGGWRKGNAGTWHMTFLTPDHTSNASTLLHSEASTRSPSQASSDGSKPRRMSLGARLGGPDASVSINGTRLLFAPVSKKEPPSGITDQTHNSISESVNGWSRGRITRHINSSFLTNSKLVSMYWKEELARELQLVQQSVCVEDSEENDAYSSSSREDIRSAEGNSLGGAPSECSFTD